METKYNLLTRLLKNIKNVVNPDGSVAGSGGVLVAHVVTEETVALSGTLPVVSESSTRLDKTYKELVDSGFFVAHAPSGLDPNGGVILLIPCGFFGDDRGCRVSFLDMEGGNIIVFVAGTENDYPVLVQNDSTGRE